MRGFGSTPDIAVAAWRVGPCAAVERMNAVFRFNDGPANMQADIVMMLSDNLRTIFARSDIVRIGTMGIEPYYAPSEETAAFIKADLPRWHEMAREAGIDPQCCRRSKVPM